MGPKWYQYLFTPAPFIYVMSLHFPAEHPVSFATLPMAIIPSSHHSASVTSGSPFCTQLFCYCGIMFSKQLGSHANPIKNFGYSQILVSPPRPFPYPSQQKPRPLPTKTQATPNKNPGHSQILVSPQVIPRSPPTKTQVTSNQNPGHSQQKPRSLPDSGIAPGWLKLNFWMLSLLKQNAALFFVLLTVPHL